MHDLAQSMWCDVMKSKWNLQRFLREKECYCCYCCCHNNAIAPFSFLQVDRIEMIRRTRSTRKLSGFPFFTLSNVVDSDQWQVAARGDSIKIIAITVTHAQKSCVHNVGIFYDCLHRWKRSKYTQTLIITQTNVKINCIYCSIN